MFVWQCCDLGYHNSLQRALRTYLSAEQNVESSKHSGLEALEGAAESLEANGDKQKVMETYNNIFCPPARFDFQSHMGDTVHFLFGLLSKWCSCNSSVTTRPCALHVFLQMGVMCAQQPLDVELNQRCQQLQPRLSTLKIENEEVCVLSCQLCVLQTQTLGYCLLCFTSCFPPFTAQKVKKTMEATLSTIQDMVTVEDFDVSECFHHSNSMESVKSTFSESYLSKPSLAKRRANQQETEQFYFTVSTTGFSRLGVTGAAVTPAHVSVGSAEAEGVSGWSEPDHQAGGRA